MKYNLWSQKELAEFKRLWADGLDDAEIGERLGRTRSCIKARRITEGLLSNDFMKTPIPHGASVGSRYMTDDEIRASHRRARNPDEQTRILAQLNGMKPGEIRKIIRGRGE